MRESWPPAAQGFAVRRPGPDGSPAWFLARREDGACVFLDDDAGCAVHARHGPEAKPAFCREYPFTLVREPSSVSVVVRADCGGWAASAPDGTPVDDRLEEVLALPRLHPVHTFAPEAIAVLPGVGVPGDQWPLVEEALQACIADEADPEATLAAMRDDLFRLMRRAPPEPDPVRAEQATGFALHRLIGALRPAVHQPPADDFETRGMMAALAHALDLLERAASGPVDRPLAPRSRAFLALVFRSQLLGRDFMAVGGLPTWLGTLALGVRVARAAAPVADDGTADPVALGHDFATFVRFTRNGAARRLLADLQPALLELAMTLGGSA